MTSSNSIKQGDVVRTYSDRIHFDRRGIVVGPYYDARHLEWTIEVRWESGITTFEHANAVEVLK